MTTKKKNALFGRYPSCDMLNNALRYIYEGKTDSACSEIVFAIEKADGYFHDDIVPIVEKVKSYNRQVRGQTLRKDGETGMILEAGKREEKNRMTDKETVLKMLEEEIHLAEYQGQNSRYIDVDLLKNALELLNNQIPVRPIIKQEMDDICSCIDSVAYCGRCGARIGTLKHNYCSECGQAVRWE